MPREVENALGNAASAYLRSARHQPIQWNEWGPEALAKAAEEDKPVLLDIGAVWCHWCHVMDRESYEDAETARIINDLYIPIKVDRDERPDVDTRYQAAVSAISGQGGWPLTAFLTPDGKPFFGGTYFPPDDRYGRPGFRRVLLTMAEAFQKRRDEVDESASSVMSAIEESESFSGRSGPLSTALLDKMIDNILQQFDERNGGFGSQPKFPHSGAIDLLIDTASRPGPHAERARNVATATLRKMAAGGIHDQLAGGFHRYSVDERWIVPHFEKMAYDNSELLKNYVHAYQSFGDLQFAQVAKGIVRWMDEWLGDREQGGFYASQDADDSLDDDGDYFTWTRDEARAALSEDEFNVAAEFLNIREIGDMHHNTAKNVLHEKGSPDSAQSTLLEQAKRKLYAARLQRKTPYVDRTIYTGWNAMCISAYITAGRGLDLPEAIAFALKSLDRALQASLDPALGVAHVVAYGESSSAARIPGVLDDYAFLGNACLDAFEATGAFHYYTAAQAITDRMLARFHDTTEGGFFDTEQIAGDPTPIGVLTARRKPLQDAPVPAGNPVAATLLLRLGNLSNNPAHEAAAQGTLAAFAAIVEHFGLYAASYGLALVRALHPPIQIFVVGTNAIAKELAAAAVPPFAVTKAVLSLQGFPNENLPPALAETIPGLPPVNGSFVTICRGNACLPPVQTVEELQNALKTVV